MIFTLQFERTVNRDNTVSIQNLRLQIEPVRWRATLAGCTVTCTSTWMELSQSHTALSVSGTTVRKEWLWRK